jgi:hypothetical protein
MKALSNILSWLKGSPSNTATSIYFHEDDYCQIELVANENEGHLRKTGAEIQQSAKQNFDGFGYKDTFIRNEEPMPLSTKRILPEQLATLLEGCGFQRIAKVCTGYSSHREQLKDAMALKLDPYVIYLDHKDGIVQHIWLEMRWSDAPENQRRFTDALDQIGRKWQLLLSDWSWPKVVDLSDHAATERYVISREG